MLARILLIASIAMMVCICVALYYGDATEPFVYSALVSFVMWAVVSAITAKKDFEVEKRDAILAVSLSWITVMLAGCLPYLISGAIPFFADAFFESVSGFTTTGSTILSDIEALPKSILFWRSLTHWIGGAGVIMLVIVIMPSLKMGGYSLFSMESSLRERVTPRIKNLITRLLAIYLILSLLTAVFLYVGGMGLFDSVCHAMGTVATGGFSTKNTSIALYSPFIQYVLTISMALGGINFIIFYYLAKGSFKKIRYNEELRYYLGIIFVTGAFIAMVLFVTNKYSLEESFRHAYFQVISVMTTTGYSTVDFMLWPSLLWIFIFFLTFTGGCSGSTSGGIKIARHVVLLKNIRHTLRTYIHPHSVRKVQVNNKTLSPEDNNTIVAFVTIYMASFVVGSILMVMIGVEAKTAFSAIASSLGSIGLGIDSIGPSGTYAHLSVAAKYICSFFMLLGRLEIYTLLLLFTPSFWKGM